MIIKNPKGFWEFEGLKKFPEVTQIISTREFKNTKFDKNLKPNLNFEKMLQKLNSKFNFVLFQQVHGSNIAIAENSMAGSVLKNSDGGVTTQPKLFLAIFVADCFPVLAYEPKSGIIGIAHVGWKGIRAGIVENLISQIVKLKSDIKNFVVGVGPGICRKCYEVKADVASQFKFIRRRNGNLYLDLESEIIEKLQKSGVQKENIETAGVCVFEEENFFSYRREKTNSRFAAIIGLKT